jgi:hypothetical protein
MVVRIVAAGAQGIARATVSYCDVTPPSSTSVCPVM